MNEKRYVLIQVPDLDEFTMPDRASNDRRARLNLAGLRVIASADVVLVVDPAGVAKVLKDRDVPSLDQAHEAATVTTVNAYPKDMA